MMASLNSGIMFSKSHFGKHGRFCMQIGIHFAWILYRNSNSKTYDLSKGNIYYLVYYVECIIFYSNIPSLTKKTVQYAGVFASKDGGCYLCFTFLFVCFFPVMFRVYRPLNQSAYNKNLLLSLPYSHLI